MWCWNILCMTSVRSHMEYARGLIGEIETSIYRACNRLHLHLPLLSNVKTRRLSVHMFASIPPCLAQCQHALENALNAVVLAARTAKHSSRVSYKHVWRARGTFAVRSYVMSVTKTTGTPFWWHSLISTDGSMNWWVHGSRCEDYGSRATSTVTTPTVA